MGNKTSKPDTPLNCVLKHFDKLYTPAVKKAYYYPITKDRLKTFCKQQWPMFGVQWPSEGTFDPEVAWALVSAVINIPSHQGYILPWAEATSNPPIWIQFYMLKNRQRGPTSVISRRSPQESIPGDKKTSKTSDIQDSPLPRPYQCPPRSKPPPKSKPPPQPSPQPQPLPQQLDHSLSFPLPTSDRALLPYSSNSLQIPQQPQSSSLTRSLATDLHDWNTQNPPFSTDRNCIAYVPLTTTDLFKWKMQYPSFSANPSSLVSLMEFIFSVHFPSWDDCETILTIFFTSEERSRILSEAAQAFLRLGTRTGRWRADVVDCVLPTWRPDQNYRTKEDRRALSNYHQALLEGIKQAARKPTDFLRVMCTRQGPKESPLDFLERLLEAYRTYTPIDPEDSINVKEINRTFVDHSAPDIRNAIQRVYGFEDMTRSELLSIAQRVFDSRESEQDLIIRTVIETLVNSRNSCDTFSHGQRPQRLRRDQCAYCKRLGHWKNECPNRRRACSRRGQF